MKKKTKKPLFDKSAPGGKMIFYGAILIIIGACINAFASWSLVVGAFLGLATSEDVFGETLNLCLQVGLSLLVAIDGINNRNRPSKGKHVMINALCVMAIAVLLMVQSSFYASSILIAGLSIGGAIVMIVGGLRNKKVFVKK